MPSGRDLNKDGKTDGPADAYGYGAFPGQYGMLVLSRFPFDLDNVRTFQKFLWKDMPGADLLVKPDTKQPYYSAEDCGTFGSRPRVTGTCLSEPTTVWFISLCVTRRHPRSMAPKTGTVAGITMRSVCGRTTSTPVGAPTFTTTKDAKEVLRLARSS